MTLSKKVIQPPSQEVIWTQVEEGAESTSWWIVCSSNSWACMGDCTNEIFPSWYSVTSAQIALGVPDPCWSLMKLPRWLNQWKEREKKEAPELDYCSQKVEMPAGWLLIQKANLLLQVSVFMALSLLSSHWCFEQIPFQTSFCDIWVTLQRWFSISSESKGGGKETANWFAATFLWLHGVTKSWT